MNAPPSTLPEPAGARGGLGRAHLECTSSSAPGWVAAVLSWGTVGWRRESISAREIAKSKLASAVLGTEWMWAGIKSMIFNDAGVLKTPWGEGKWGLAMRPKGMPQCAPPNECLFADFSGAAHHLYFDLHSKFVSVRVGDGEVVNGTRVRH